MIVIIVLIFLVIGLLVYKHRTQPVDVSDEKLDHIKNLILPLDPRIADLNFHTDSKEAYTLGREDIYICLHNADGGYESDNFLVYVALHEVSHALIEKDTKEHPPEFVKLFDELKQKAQKLGIYNPSIPFPAKYCKRELNFY